MMHAAVYEIIAAESAAVAVEHHLIFAGGSQEAIVGETLRRIPVEYKYQVATHERQHIVAIFLPEFLHRERLEIVDARHKLHHSIVESVEKLVFELLTVYKAPLTAGIFITPAVTLAREVNPLRMAELIAHEVEIAAVDGGERHETYHLVERHATGHYHILVVDHHMPVHLLVNKPENYGLVAHESLVVALAVTDCLLVSAAVGKFPEDGGRMPVLILTLLDHLDPVVGYTHGHAVVETYAAVFKPDRQPRHSAHLLGNRYRLGVDLVDKYVGECQIGQRVRVLVAVVIVSIRTEGLP